MSKIWSSIKRITEYFISVHPSQEWCLFSQSVVPLVLSFLNVQAHHGPCFWLGMAGFRQEVRRPPLLLEKWARRAGTHLWGSPSLLSVSDHSFTPTDKVALKSKRSPVFPKTRCITLVGKWRDMNDHELFK